MRWVWFVVFFGSIGCFSQLDSAIVDQGIPHNPTIIPIKVKKKVPLYNRVWGPLGLAAMSVTTSLDSTKYGLQEFVRRPVSDTFHTKLDDYLLWAPVVMMYGADLFKVKAKNTVWNQTKFLVMSEVLTAGLMLALKYTFRFQRPDGTQFNSYPSGHTSQAFCQAQVFFNEYRDTHPIFASTGYAFAISTGTLRVLNNRHWVPDVLLGASIGMLMTNLVYHFEPLKNWNPFKRKKNKATSMMLVPSIGTDYNGFTFRMGI